MVYFGFFVENGKSFIMKTLTSEINARGGLCCFLEMIWLSLSRGQCVGGCGSRF